jgi:hypothetical protein
MDPVIESDSYRISGPLPQDDNELTSAQHVEVALRQLDVVLELLERSEKHLRASDQEHTALVLAPELFGLAVEVREIRREAAYKESRQ